MRFCEIIYTLFSQTLMTF